MHARSLSHPSAVGRGVCWPVAIIIAAVAGCASGNVDVNTQVAPQANFGSYHTYELMTPHLGSARENPAAQDDPMLNNSITNQAIRAEIRQRMESLGYQPAGSGADIGVAVYAASRRALDVTTVDYGYPFRPWWFGPRREVIPVTKGTVVIDVVDRNSNRLIWRGVGRSEVSDNPDDYARDLKSSVDQVLKKLPRSGS